MNTLSFVFKSVPRRQTKQKGTPLLLPIAWGNAYKHNFNKCYEWDEISFLSEEEFAKTHSNYRLTIAQTQIFKNIQIQIHEGKWGMVSKAKAPVIHFVIRHPKMLHAFENFTVPVMES